jgi:DNA-binding transcriptional LysR family regulator
MSASLDDLMSMAVFARVVREQSFTAAAPHLGLSKSVVSERVSALEHRLGTRLLHRTTRKLSLTPEGERLYVYVQRVLEAADEAADATSALGTRVAGRLRVTAPVGFGLVQLAGWLADFARAYPDIALELSVSDRVVDLVAESYDVAIRIASRMPDSAMLARRVATDHRIVVAAPAYLRARGEPRTVDDLRDHACLRLAGNAAEWTFAGRGEARLRPAISGPLTADNLAVLRIAAVDGLGLAVMPRTAVGDDLAAGRLVAVLAGLRTEAMGIYLVSPHRNVPAKVRAFMEFVAARIGGPAAPKRARKRRVTPAGQARTGGGG